MTLKKNALWNILGSGGPALLGVVTVPYLLRGIGVEGFGILTLVWALIGYFSLFDFGLGRALTQQVGANRASGLVKELPGLIKTGLLLTLLTGVLGGVILLLTSHPLGFKWLKVSPALRQSTFFCLLISSLGIPVTTLTSGLKGILEAYEDFRIVNLLRIFLGIANFGFPVLCIMFFGPRLEFMVTSLIIARLLVLFGHLYFVNKKISRWTGEISSKKHITGLLSFGAWMTVSNIISPLMVTADRFVISSVVGASLIAYYTVPFEMLFRILIVPAAITSALFPRLTSLIQTDLDAAKLLYKKALAVVAGLMFLVCLSIALCSFWGLTLWLGRDFAVHSWLITCVLAIGILFNGMAQIPHAAIQAGGNVKATALVHLFELIIYVPLLIICLKFWGIIGAPIVWSIRAFGDFLVLLFVANRKA